MSRFRFLLTVLFFVINLAVFGAKAADKTYVVFHSLSDPLRALTATKLVYAKFDVDSIILQHIDDYKAYYRVASGPFSDEDARLLLDKAKKSHYPDAWLLRSEDEETVFFSVSDASQGKSISTQTYRRQPQAEQTSVDTPATSGPSLWKLNTHAKSDPVETSTISEYANPSATGRRVSTGRFSR